MLPSTSPASPPVTVVSRVLAVRVVNDVRVLLVVKAVLHDAALGVVGGLALHVHGALSLTLGVLASGVVLTHVAVSEPVLGAATLPMGVAPTGDAVNPLTAVGRRSSGRGSPSPQELVATQPTLEDVPTVLTELSSERGLVDPKVRH
jgi:hypothetical protein